MRRDARFEGIVPDAAHAEALRRHDFPFVVVADHPGVAGIDLEPLQRVSIDREFGLALAELAFDLDMVEAMAEIEAHDLVALRLGRAVGDQGELDASLAQGVDGGVGIGIELVFVAPHLGESIGDAIGQRLVGVSEPGEAAPHREPPGALNIEPPLGGGL